MCLRGASDVVYERIGIEPPPKSAWYDYVNAYFPKDNGDFGEDTENGGRASERVETLLLLERIERDDIKPKEFDALQCMLALNTEKTGHIFSKARDVVEDLYSNLIYKTPEGPERVKVVGNLERDFSFELSGGISKIMRALKEADMPYPQMRILFNWFTVEYESYEVTPSDIPALVRRMAPLNELKRRQLLVAS